MSLVNKYLGIIAFKHDGSFHRMWSHCLVLEDNEDFIVLGANKTRVIESNFRRWRSKYPGIFIFYKKEWANLFVSITEDRCMYYVNIASPIIIEDSYIKWVDYDLDIKTSKNDSPKVFDTKEYQSHAVKYGYSEQLKKLVELSSKKQFNDCMKKVDFYNHELVMEYYNKYLKLIQRSGDK